MGEGSTRSRDAAPRHTYASILVALGEDPCYAMEQIGHTDPGFTLRIYTHGMRRGDDERDSSRAFVPDGPGTSGHNSRSGGVR